MQAEIARALANLTTGIYVLTVADGERRHGMSSSWVTQVSGDPPLIMAAVDNAHFSHQIVTTTRRFGLNIVGSRTKDLEDYFYSSRARRPDNLEGVDYELSPTLAVPWLALAMISIEAEVRDAYVAGDHTMFVAEIVGVGFKDGDRPLTSLDLEYVYVGGREVLKRDRTGWA